MDLKMWPVFTLLESSFLSKIKLAYVYRETGNGAIFVTEEDEVWTFDQEIFNRATDQKENILKPKLIENLKGKRVKAFSSGLNHIVALTEKGEVYTWGHNESGQLGTVTRGDSNPVPDRVTGLLVHVKIIEITCGKNHTLVLSDKGEVFGWGGNYHGQIGDGYYEDQLTPRKIPLNGFCTKISCGADSSFAILNNGQVYCWTADLYAQFTGITSPNMVVNLPKVSKLACAASCTLFLSYEGDIHYLRENTPIKIIAKDIRFMDIAATYCSDMCVAMTAKNHVYVRGTCRGRMTPFIYTPYNNMHEAFAYLSVPRVCYKTLVKFRDFAVPEGNDIRSTLSSAFDNSGSTDFTITVEGQPIHVHKTILTLRSEYFRNMFAGKWKEVEENALTVETRTYVVYREFLKYLYTDKVDVTAENAVELLDIAREHLQKPLEQTCIQIMKNGTNPGNVISFYSAAVAIKCQELEEFCFSYALNNLTEIVLSPAFSSLDAETQKYFIQSAAQRGLFKT